MPGLWDADKKAPYNNPDPYVELLPTWTSHFYDPDSGTNWAGQRTPTALSEGCKFYRKSQRAYRKEDWSKAGYNLGLAVHYLSDLTQPMHAANFTWLDSKDFGYHTDFERYVKDKLHRIQTPRRYKPYLEASPYKAFFHAAARHSKDCYYALLCRPEWTQGYSKANWEEPVWEARVGALIPHILGDAVQIVAQFLLLWCEDSVAGEF